MDNTINAFEAGVTEGGLRNTMQIKVLVEYLVDCVNEITQEIVVEAFMTHELANYFETSQAVSELIDNGTILKDKNGFLQITAKGLQTLRELVKEIPLSVRETAVADATAAKIRLRHECENTARIITVKNGYDVVLSVMHKDDILMQLTVYAPDYEQALDMKEKFIDDPAKVYATLLSLLSRPEDIN